MASAGQYNETATGILDAYSEVPHRVVDCSRSDLETFDAICEFVEEVAKRKASALGPEGMRAFKEAVRSGQSFCFVGQ